MNQSINHVLQSKMNDKHRRQRRCRLGTQKFHHTSLCDEDSFFFYNSCCCLLLSVFRIFVADLQQEQYGREIWETWYVHESDRIGSNEGGFGSEHHMRVCLPN